MSLFSGVALVIGAGSDDGRAVAQLLVKNGCRKLVLGNSNETDLRQVEVECRALGDSTLHVLSTKCDTKVPADLDQIIASAVDKFGEINYCANCERPGGFEGKTTEISLAEFSSTGETWQRGNTITGLAGDEIRGASVSGSKENGRKGTTSIVNISAAQALASDSGFPSYCSTAHGIVGMSRATAMDYLRDGIRINCVYPGPSARLAGESRDASRVQKRTLPAAPFGRDISSEEVAQAVVSLLGEGASSITGSELPVDGGWSSFHH